MEAGNGVLSRVDRDRVIIVIAGVVVVVVAVRTVLAAWLRCAAWPGSLHFSILQPRLDFFWNRG